MATKNTPQQPQTKADFVRSLPDTPAKDVVAKAAQAKLELTESHVHAVRSEDRARANQKKKSAKSGTTTKAARKKSSSKKSSSKTAGRKPGKKALVQSLKAANPTWTASQIAKEVGCSEKYVYLTWRATKKKKKTKTAKVSSAKKKPAATASATTTEFYKVLKRVGVDEAKRLIANIEAYANA